MTTGPFDFQLNPAASRGTAYPRAAADVLDRAGYAAARTCIEQWPGYAVTPLRSLAGLAKSIGIGALHYKDEGSRFGLGSFKPLGGAYAVARLLQRRLAGAAGSESIAIADMLAGRYSDAASAITVTAATDGNHGRSVAWGAQLFGCRCVIFIHETVTAARERAIASYGAEVRRTPGTYDDAVRTAQATAEAEGWFVIPDTSDGTIVDAPRDVMQGYTIMAAETIEQLPYVEPPTHLFLQAGVGGMAAATCSQFWLTFAEQRPRTVLVEPAAAGCWYESLSAGDPVTVGGDLESIMAGLACGEVSRLAWKILKPGADAMLRIGDDAAADVMRLLADGRCGDHPVIAGESAVAGLAGLLAVAADDAIRTTLALDGEARVVVFGTEGATDPESYARIVGRPPERVAA
jgi:diaminopropionate ammonia-lyase